MQQLLPSQPILSFLARGNFRKLRPRRHVSTKSTDPLRILFCGSDAFSIASLQALVQEQRSNPKLIASIDVVCRPPKRVGRGLKVFREEWEVPVAQVAREMNLPLHEIDTFTRWNPPKPHGENINLVVAVSFGLFVPGRILEQIKYGGLNVHPSMLPDFRGPAPLHHTLLCNEENIGVTMQTLHPGEFDRGQILAQSEYPGFKHSCDNVPDLEAMISQKAARMFVKGLRDLVFVSPRQDVGWYNTRGNIRPVRHAPKITPEDRHIDWGTWPAKRILRTHQIIGPLWNIAGAIKDDTPLPKRVIWSSGFTELAAVTDTIPQPGHPIVHQPQSGTRSILIRTCDGHTLKVNDAKIEGERATASPWHQFKKFGMVNYPDDPSATSQTITPFVERLR